MSKTKDLARLPVLADELEAANEIVKRLYAERRRIWLRHIIRGDVSQAQLARASRVERSEVGRVAKQKRDAKTLVA